MTRTWLVTLALLCSCVEDEPVLTGIPATPLLSEKDEASTQEQPKKGSQQYEKSEAVLVDVRYLGGKPYEQTRDIVSVQLGQLLSTRDLERNGGKEMQFERGRIRVIDKTIAMIRIPLQQPMRRTQALEALGFPPYVGGYTIFHREYRLHHEWGFRRIRLMREDRHSERVIEVEAWRWLPGERDLGR